MKQEKQDVPIVRQESTTHMRGKENAWNVHLTLLVKDFPQNVPGKFRKFRKS